MSNYNEIEEIINLAAEVSIPIKNNGSLNNRKYPPTPWWDEECTLVTKNRKEALAQFRNEPSMESFLNVKKHIAIAKKND